MKKLICISALFILGFKNPCFAYLMYQNSRIDHALYDGHDPKLVVTGKITGQVEVDKPEGIMVIDGPPGPVSIHFKIDHVIMGDGSFEGKILELPTLSFDWPQELVKLETGKTCTLIIRIYNRDKKEYHIDVVAPFNESNYNSYPKMELAVADNNGVRKFLEQQILAELKIEKDTKRQQALLEQVGPITSQTSENEILPFSKSANEWVKRAALAALVFSTQKQEYVQELAKDINAFFTKYDKENEMIGGELEYYNYSASYLYYRFVFFLDPSQRQWGSRWDDTEARTNENLVAKLKATGYLSKKVQHKLKC